MTDALPSHPYYPLTASIPGYVANQSSTPRLLVTFGVLASVVLYLSHWQASQASLRLKRIDRFAVMWFALCGFLHVGFEGYYLYNRATIVSKQTTFAQLWKEYTLSDSRYLTSDVFTICVETITVLAWGPLCWVTYFSILRNSPYRYINQAIVCTAHLYGVALYYSTNWLEFQSTGVSYSRPEFQYFWVYYVGLNLPWAVVPLVFLYDSYRQVAEGFRTLELIYAAQKTQ